MEYSTLGQAWINCMGLVINEGVWEKDAQVRLKERRNVSICIKSISEQDKIIEQYADQVRCF